MAGHLVRKERRCEKCGRVFALEYDRQTGEAFESWQTGCKTLDECRVRILGPLSDFVPWEALGLQMEG